MKQLDFVGAFLQAKMRTRMFVTIPKIFGTLFPEYATTGRPVWLLMSMYGTALCGKYWYLDLLDFLKEIGFNPNGMTNQYGKNLAILILLLYQTSTYVRMFCCFHFTIKINMARFLPY